MDNLPRLEDHKSTIVEILKSVRSALITGKELTPAFCVFAFAWTGEHERIATGAKLEAAEWDTVELSELAEAVLSAESKLYGQIIERIGVAPQLVVYCERGLYYCSDPAAIANWKAQEPPPRHDSVLVTSHSSKALLLAIAPVYVDERTLGPAWVYFAAPGGRGLEPVGKMDAHTRSPLTRGLSKDKLVRSQMPDSIQ
jgi:hypothetical protein